MNQEEMKQRTKLFALGIIQLVESLPKDRIAGVLGGQLLRSGTQLDQTIGVLAEPSLSQILFLR